MASAPDANKDSYIELKIAINKNLPATPGDKEVSRIIKVKSKGLPEVIQLWTEIPPQKLQLKSVDGTLSEEKDMEEKFRHWDGEAIIILKKPYVNDIVPFAGLPDPPGWQVRVSVCKDGAPIISEQKPSAPASQNPNPSTSISIPISIFNVEQKKPSPPEHKEGFNDSKQPVTETESNKTEEAETALRVNILLSFDGNKYIVFPYHRWPAHIHPKEYINTIYKDICDDNQESIKYLILKRYIQTPRLSLDEIHEGEWMLPVFINDDNQQKQLLTYIKVTIEWITVEPKPADKR